MNNIFNTTFETALRILLILEQSPNTYYSADMLAAIDFMTVYAQDFNIDTTNLHGDGLFKFSEFATRRSLTKDAINDVVLKNLVTIDTTENGFEFQINQNGQNYIGSLESNYAVTYRDVVIKTIDYVKNMTESQVLNYINEHSIRSLQKGQ